MPDDAEKILALMRTTADHAFLASCDGVLPAVRWVSPIVEAVSCIWVATFADASKVRQVRANPHVVLLFTSLPSGEQSVRVDGMAQVVVAPAEKRRVWKLAPYDLASHFPDGPDSASYGLLRIRPQRISWRESWESEARLYLVS